MSPPAPGAGGALLPESDRRLHRALLDALVATGAVPSLAALAAATGIEERLVPVRLRTLAAADYAAFDPTGRLTCLYPFSAVPTPHVVEIDGQRRHAMCAIDALGTPAMLGRELAIEGRCGACGAAIGLRVRPGAVAVAEPPGAVVVARRDETEPACRACCPFTVFACGGAHAEQLAARTSGSQVLSLEEARRHAEALFGDLLRAPTLPAARPRGGDWGETEGG